LKGVYALHMKQKRKKIQVLVGMEPEVKKVCDELAKAMKMNRSQFVSWMVTTVAYFTTSKDLEKAMREEVKKILGR
jgi:hypothetical protein